MKRVPVKLNLKDGRTYYYNSIQDCSYALHRHVVTLTNHMKSRKEFIVNINNEVLSVTIERV